MITGVVVDENGNPVPQAKVRLAEGLRAMNLEKTIPTGSDGKFVIDNVKWGTYTVQAMKPEDGYPDPFVLMYRYHVIQPTVTVSPAQPVADIVVPIGPQDGSLRIKLMDAKTGVVLKSSVLTLRRLDDPRVSIQVQLNPDATLIPSGAPIMITVHVDGYSDWYYPGTIMRSFAKPLSLAPGEEKSLEIRLEPLRSE